MSSESLLTELAETQLRRACADLDRRLRAGEECRSEEYFESNPALAADDDHALELVYTEFATREALGQLPTVDEFAARFPLWRDRLIRLIQVHEALSDGGGEGELPIASATDTPAGLAAGTWPASRSPTVRSEQPRRIGPYELLEEIGRGGMGVVYKARQLGLGRVVALKTILSQHAGDRDRARFRAEAEAAARLQHPHIVQIYDVGEQDGCPFFAMELVEGTSLDRHLAQAPLPARTAAELIETLARAMHYAHGRGIIHRDLKPANILLESVEDRDLQVERPRDVAATSNAPLVSLNPKISDFGLAKQLSHRFSPDALTRTGALIGTPSYMSPEQAGGKTETIGPPADVYALGAILYETLTGVPPFQGATALDTLEQVRSNEPIAPRRLRAELSRELETICLKCLEKQPGKRYTTAGQLADDLRRFLSGEPIEARPIGIWERAGKWARRRPAVAALIATVAAVTLLGFAVVTWAWFNAETNRVAAERSRLDAVAAYGKAEAARVAEQAARVAAQAERERAEKLLYDHNIALAYHEYLANNTNRATQLLDRCRSDLRGWEWLYLNRICHSEELTLTGLTLPVQSLAYSPDGRRIAASSGRTNRPDPGEICVWDAGTGHTIYTSRAKRGSISSLTFSPDGRKLIGANTSIGIRVWNMDDGSEQSPIKLASAVRVAISPDGQSLAAGCTDGRVVLFDCASGKKLRELKGHDRTVLSVAFSPDGSRLASGSWDGSARIWSVADGQSLRDFNDLQDVRVVAFSPDGTLLGAATFSGMIRIWRVESGTVVATHQSRIRGAHVALSPDGLSLAFGTSEVGTQIWRTTSGTHARTFPQNSTRVSFSPEGTRLAAAGIDETVKVWEVASKPNPREFTVTDGARIADIEYSPDGNYLALVTRRNTAKPSSGRDDKTLRIWDTSSQRIARVCRGHTDWLTSVAFSSDGQCIATGSLDKTVRVWATESGELQHTLEGHTAAVTGVTLSANGQRLASATSAGTLRFWDTTSGEPGRTWQGHEQGIKCIAFAPSGECFASGGDDNIVRIWNPATGDAIASLPCPSVVNRLAFSRDGKLLASAGADGHIRIWKVTDIVDPDTDGQPLNAFQGHTDAVTGLGFSSDSKRLVSSAGEDRSVKIWDVTAGDEVITLRASPDDNPRVKFSPDGRFLTMSLAHGMAIWDSQGDQNELLQGRAQISRISAK